jgi:hypothetical protein
VVEYAKMRTAYFVGAGSSYGTPKDHPFAFPPLARDFGSVLTSRAPDWLNKYPELAKVAEHLGTALPKVGLEEIWTCIDYHAKFDGAFKINWNRGQVVRELKNALVVLYGRKCDEEAANLSITSSYALGRIVQEMKPGDTLVSFNYDTLVERLARKQGITLLHGCGLPPEGVVRFAKPHGSASWNLYSLGHDLTDGPPAVVSLDPGDAMTGRVDPLLLGAVPIKSELIVEVQCYYHAHRVFEVILRQWRAIADAVRDADRIVVLGYSFPKEDAYGRFFFHEAFRERSKPLRVEYYELPDKKEQAACSITSAFPGGLCIQYMGEVEPAPDSAFAKT